MSVRPARGRSSRPQALRPGVPVARSGRSAIDLAERLLCGDGAVRTASIAEGLALSGRRAASLLEGSAGSTPAAGPVSGRAAWVHHRVRPDGPDVGERFPVRLEARTAQQAVDHCLVAHLVADRDQPDGPDAGANDVDSESVPVPHFGLVLPWEDWEDVTARLEAAGTDFVIPPTVRFRGRTGEQGTAFVRDPSGNALEFKAFRNPREMFADHDH